MNAVIYSRFSPRPDADESLSIETQLDRCRAYCVANGYAVIGEYDDRNQSGARADNRDGLQAALAQACRRKAVLVVYSLSRLARNTADAISMATALEKSGAHLAMLDLQVDTSSPTGRFFFSVMAAFHQLDREQIAARTKDAMLRHQSNGRRMSKKTPYGWKVNPANPMLLVRDDAEQAVVARIMEAASMGKGLRRIARELNAAGLRCRDGKDFYHQLVARVIRREGGVQASPNAA